MSVKASSQITVSIERDTQAVYRFYKLQSSTAAVPSKPTSINTLPPSGWTTTEPSYTEGSTNSLYTVDLTVFTDGTFSYTDVSLSTSYEAAKAAYNKAVAAKSTADAKNAVFYQAAAPSTTGRKVNDIWFDTDDGNRMYYWSGSAWTAQQFGTDAISNSAITADLLAADSVTADKIVARSITAAKIASNTITSNEINVQELFAQNITATGSIRGMRVFCNDGKIGGWEINSNHLLGTQTHNTENGEVADGYIKLQIPGWNTGSAIGTYRLVAKPNSNISLYLGWAWSGGGSRTLTIDVLNSADSFTFGYSGWAQDLDGGGEVDPETGYIETGEIIHFYSSDRSCTRATIEVGEETWPDRVEAGVSIMIYTKQSANSYLYYDLAASLSKGSEYFAPNEVRTAGGCYVQASDGFPDSTVPADASVAITNQSGIPQFYVRQNGNVFCGVCKADSVIAFGKTISDLDDGIPGRQGGVRQYYYEGTALNRPESGSGNLLVYGDASEGAAFTQVAYGQSGSWLRSGVVTEGETVYNEQGWVRASHVNSVTAATAGTKSATSGSTLAVPYVTYDAEGHITASGTHTHTVTGFLTSHQTIKQDGVTGATIKRFGTCSTAAATAAKTVSIANGTFSLESGARVTVKFSNANTADNPTLNVASTGAKNIFSKGSRITTGGNKALLAGAVDFVYDGTQFHLVGNYIDTNTNTTYSAEKGIALASGKFGHSNSVTAGTIGSSSASSGWSLSVPYATFDAYGHITGKGTHTHTIAKVLYGTTGAISTPGKEYKDLDVTFSSAFSNAPTIIVGFVTSSTAGAFGSCSCAVMSKSTSRFTVRVFNNDTTARAPAVSWIAIASS